MGIRHPIRISMEAGQLSEYHLSTLQNIVYIEKENAVLATFIDITREEELAQEDYEKKLETIDLAQKVIHKQMMVAQEIAGLWEKRRRKPKLP